MGHEHPCEEVLRDVECLGTQVRYPGGCSYLMDCHIKQKPPSRRKKIEMGGTAPAMNKLEHGKGPGTWPGVLESEAR